MEIDFETYKANEDNYYDGRSNKKKQIILSFSLREDNYHLIRFKNKQLGKYRGWTTFTISREGNVYQHFDPKYYSDFIGKKTIDRSSISITLENMGSLYRDNDTFYNWLNEKCPVENVVTKKILGGTYWEKIFEKQNESLINLIKKLCGEYDISREVIDFHFYNETVNKFDGVVFASNYIEDSQNINPLLDINYLKNELK